MDPILGEIKLFAGNFAPKGWYTCEGQTLSIATNSALFSLLGTTYGGDGVSTFKLPDLRGAFATQCTNISSFHPGGTYSYGQTGGTQSFSIGASNLPPHTHTIIKGTGTNISGTVSVSATLNVNNTSTGSTAVPSVGNSISAVADLASSGAAAGIYNTAAPNTALNTNSVTTTTNNTLNFDPTGLTMTPYGSGPIPVPTVPPFVAMQYIIAWQGMYPSRP